MKIWLDDIREAPHGWVRCFNAEDVIDILGRSWEVVTDISLDHDLGDGLRTGYDVVTYIESTMRAYHLKPPTLSIHSANPVGRKNMEAGICAIEKYARNAF